MKTRIHKLQADGLYLIQSQASSNNLYFEYKHDHELFFSLIEEYLAEVIDVVHYVVLQTGWSMLFRTKNAKTIKESYFKRRKLSKKANPLLAKTEISDMLSEHFRYFISAYVRRSNQINGRHGSKVHSRMKKYIFENEEALADEVSKMESYDEFNQQEERYQADMYAYEAASELEDSHLLRNGRSCYGAEGLEPIILSCFVKLLNFADVVRKLISETYFSIFGKNPPNSSPPLPS